MSKLPERNSISGYIRPKDNVGYIVAYDDGQERTLISAHGFHLESSDFSDLLLPSILFVDEKSTQHEVSINANKQLMIDNKPINDLAEIYTKKEVDDLVKQNILVSPNGSKWKLNVTDSGEVTTIKQE